ncbi:hypothetical protein EJB05_40177 [Eragrostis curvula]|uniref:Major facilitator superfamily (MFS) profile domain-containing protein n=1 Tax=Eragrostis curvula TaxID=38414 RepID=A0A5J9TYZ5_9POAL|nr:hypothetical protein EJB05_40177 [Eragrostis curvula]
MMLPGAELPASNGSGMPSLPDFMGKRSKYVRMDDVLPQEQDEGEDGGVRVRRSQSSRRYVLACSVFASLNSVLLGYDVGVMSGCILFIQRDLHINEVQQEVLVGCLSFISLLGSLAGGRTSDAIGRKWTIGFAATVFQAGAAVMTFAPSFRVLMIGRLLAGVGIGFGLMVAPVYIAEISPAATVDPVYYVHAMHEVDLVHATNELSCISGTVAVRSISTLPIHNLRQRKQRPREAEHQTGMMGLQAAEATNGGGILPSLFGGKSRYARMDDVLPQDQEEDGGGVRVRGSGSSRRYVFACSVFASLNHVLLGYGESS